MPGDDLRGRLAGLARERDFAAAFAVAGIGSLSQAAIRLAGAVDAVIRTGNFEIVSLSGTLGEDGVHLHAALADANGQMFGGHVGRGCIVRTTAEILIVALPGWTFRRGIDPATGYRELQINAPD
jgi:uncharacterized protein